MPGTGSILVGGLGGVLILLGFTGGGFGLFGATVTSIVSNLFVRVLAGVLGGLLVLAAVLLENPDLQRRSIIIPAGVLAGFCLIVGGLLAFPGLGVPGANAA